MLKRVKERKNATEVSPWMPSATPVSSVSPAPETALLTSCAVPEVPLASASLAQPSIVLSALSAAASICADCSTIPPTTSRKIPTAIAARASSTRPAPAARGTPRRASHATPGAQTAATTAPVTTGSTMEEVRPRIQTTPTRMAATPTSSHEMRPRPRSHCGATNIRARSPGAISATAARASRAGTAGRRRRRNLMAVRPGAAPPARRAAGGAPRSPRGSCVSVSIPCRRRTVCMRPLAAAPETTEIRAMPVNMTRDATIRPRDVGGDDVSVAHGRHGLGRPPERDTVVGEVLVVDQPHDQRPDQHGRRPCRGRRSGRRSRA